jgi:NitT/TauT family transport system ATP-binding protein
MITHDVEEAVFLSNRIYALSARPGTVQRESRSICPNAPKTLSVTPHSTTIEMN